MFWQSKASFNLAFNRYYNVYCLFHRPWLWNIIPTLICKPYVCWIYFMSILRLVYTVSQSFSVMSFIMVWKIKEWLLPSTDFYFFVQHDFFLVLLSIYMCYIFCRVLQPEMDRIISFYMILYTCQVQPFLTGIKFYNLQTRLGFYKDFQTRNHIVWHITKLYLRTCARHNCPLCSWS